MEFKQKKAYGGFYSTSNSSSICTLVPTKEKINVYYSAPKNDPIQISDFVKSDNGKGHYGLGNLYSVQQACAQVDLHAEITSSKINILEADAVILPGVGAAANSPTVHSVFFRF